MIKYIVLLTNFLILSVFSLFRDQDVSVNMEVPTEVQAGGEFQVDITISKGDIETFSRYIQDLPYGLTASRISTENADFSFEDQRVRFIWLKLPPREEFTVSYLVKVDERLKGSFTLSGEFSFIEENERKSVNVYAGHEVKIIPNPDIPDDRRVHIDDFERLVLPEMEDQNENQLGVVRRDPYMSGAHEITVELEVNKKDLNKFAKIEEYVPEGFRAVAGETQNAIFSFTQGTVKFLWMELPEEPQFTVSYKLIPDPDKTIDDLNVSGSFSYIMGNESKTVAIVEKNYDIADQESGTPEKTPEPEINIDTTAPAQQIEPEAKSVTPEKQQPARKVSEENRAHLLRPDNGIYYRVQLAAGHNPVNIDKYFAKLNIKDSVKMEFHEGWRKYTVGSFDIYKEARDYRVKIWNTTSVDDAFVAAYNNGKRITVQEALMITNQQWYK